VTSKYPILDYLSVPPEILKTWQETTNLIADILHIPAALIMRVHEQEIEVFVSSNSEGNIYEPGERAFLDTGLYCETVMDTKKPLLVANALDDPQWDHNPDIELGMISYYGLPLLWPSGELFGTLCILDTRKNAYTDTYRSLLMRFRDSVQLSMSTLYENYLMTTETAQAKQQIRLLSQAVRQSPVAVIITDPKVRVEYVNPAFEWMTGYRAEEILGKNPDAQQSDGKSPWLNLTLLQTLTSQRSWDGELNYKKKSGEYYWVRLHIVPVMEDHGVVEHYLAIQEDITKQKDQERRLVHQAFYDTLTGLPNRALVLDRLDQLLNEAQRSKHQIAVMFLDLDDFKKVNDSLGHEEGDNLLMQAAKRLRESVREGDTVGRFGGDEFVVLLSNLDRASDTQPVALNLLKRFQEVFQSNGRDIILTASLGIAIYPNDGSTPSELLRNADSAMYYSKGIGRNTYSYFTHAMNKEVSRRLILEEQMHGAVGRGEFSISYQPKVEVASGSIIGVEALIRWNNPVLGRVAPEEFIPIAEQTGLIVPIGHYVLSEAMSMAVHWLAISNQEFNIAINLSPRQFRDPQLVSSILSVLDKAMLPGDALELEITEGVLMNAYTHVNEALTKLTNLGITIAMDDFGTGYSSLSYLRRYPFNVLKIDRSFVDDIVADRGDRELIVAAIAMAHGMGLKVVAEGVETDQQLEMLSEYHCDIVQGFLFRKPVTANEITSILKQQHGGIRH
jgi:diguanylate cyclase (GGDEF)-like protein/PAS domain S-box-containing protein